MRKIALVCLFVAAFASLSASQGQLGQAVADRDRVEALRHYRLGQDSLRSEHYDDAEREFQKASKLDPTLELAPYGLGQVYMATKRYRPAITFFEKCREVFRANTVTAAGDEMAHQRRINDQIKELEDQQSIYSGPGRHGNPAAVNVYLQTLATQIAAMKSAKMRTTAGPEPVPAWISLALGSAYFRTDATADAEREYRAALAVDPKLGEAHNNLAVVCMMTGRYPEAQAEIAAAEKAGFKVNPQLKEDVKNASTPR
jgi:tetratricopeptide (TPR) repeat protein